MFILDLFFIVGTCDGVGGVRSNHWRADCIQVLHFT